VIKGLNDTADEVLGEVFEAISRSHASHAYIVEGPDGSFTESFCRSTAQALMCSGEGSRPCGVCRDCIKMRDGIHPDFEVLLPKKDKKNIQLEQIRELRGSLFVLPNEAAVKVYYIPMAQRLTAPDQNALLKAIEEPPAFAAFILSAASADVLLPVIRSRAAKITLTPPDGGAVTAMLCSEFPGLEESVVRETVLICSNDAGLARELLSDPELDTMREFTLSFYTRLSGGKKAEFTELSQYVSKNKGKNDMLAKLLHVFARDIIVFKTTGEKTVRFCSCIERIRELSERFTIKQLMGIEQAIEDYGRAVQANANRNLAVFMLFNQCWEMLY